MRQLARGTSAWLLCAVAALSAVPTTRAQPAATAASEADRSFVMALDHAWSSGEPRRVLDLFRGPHPQVRSEIGGRVQMSTAGRPVNRRSEISRSFAFGEHRALHLRTTIAMSEPQPASATFFEVLVLRARGEERHGVLLAATSAEYQAAVKSSLGDGSPIGDGLRATCKACNYELVAPQGKWAMVLRDPQTSGCLEGFEIWALDRDLACEISIHATTADDVLPAPETLARACAALAQGCGQPQPKCSPSQVPACGLQALQGKFVLDAFGGRRGFLVQTLRSGVITYVLAVQGAPEVVDGSSGAVDDLLGMLRVLDARQPPDAARVLRAHRRGGFTGATFRNADLGLELTGPEMLHTFERLGATSFQAGWSCPITGSFLLLAGHERREAPWSLAAARAWLASWVRAPRGGAESECVPSDPPEQVEVAAHPCWRLGYSSGPAASPTRGFLVAIPHGRTLVTVQGEVTPGQHQEQVLAWLVKTVSTLRLAPVPPPK